jgi:oligopeptidase A
VARYAFSDQEVKQYFPEMVVLPGMFKVVESIYGVRIAPKAAATWHPDVRFFEIIDREGRAIGQFYLDLYAREAKRGGAWMDDARGRRRRNGALQTPVAYLNCNFSRPLGRQANKAPACSPTTKSSLYFTSSVTVCTTCSPGSRN